MDLETLRYPVGRFDAKMPLPAGGRGALITSLADVPARMRAAVNGLSDAQLDTPYRDGGWSVRQLVHHVPDSHLNAYVRMKWTVTEDNPTIKTYDEKLWSELGDARTAPVDVSLELLAAVHARWDLFLRSLADRDFERPLTHPEWGQMQLVTLLKQYEWHGRHHVAHVTRLRERSGWA